MTDDKIISLEERRALQAKDPEQVEPPKPDIYAFIGRIHAGEEKGVHEICIKCQKNSWRIVHFGKGMLMGSCNTVNCEGATFMDFR